MTVASAGGTGPSGRTAGGPGVRRCALPGRRRGPAGHRDRNGEDLAAVIPLEHLERVREILAGQEVERSAAEVDWTRSKPSPDSIMVR